MTHGASTRQDRLDALTAAIGMSAQFRRLRHTRRCQRHGCWLAVDQADQWLCDPCQRNGGGRREGHLKAGRRPPTAERRAARAVGIGEEVRNGREGHPQPRRGP